MMTQIRRDGDDDKTWVMTYGDSITDGFGASDMYKLGYTNLLKEGLKIVHPSFDLIRNSAGFRCVNKECERPCYKDAYCQEAHTHNVSAVTIFVGTNDCKGKNWNLENFKRDYLELCHSFRNMSSKPDVFVIVPPPVYKDGFGKVNITLTNRVLPKVIPPIAKECGLQDSQIINLHEAMGGEKLSKPFFYCSGRHCDGYHPIDEGQDMMAQTIMDHILAFYQANPRGRLEQLEGEKTQPSSTTSASSADSQKKDE